MKMQPTAWFWIVAAAVLAVALFTVGNAHGQSTGSAAVFEGRPAMPGAQAGTGPLAGPPQGGLGDPTRDAAGGVLPLPRRGDGAGPGVPRDPGLDRPAGEGGAVPRRDRDPGQVVQRERGQDATGGATSTTRKAKRAGKRSVERARRGVSGVDS